MDPSVQGGVGKLQGCSKTSSQREARSQHIRLRNSALVFTTSQRPVHSNFGGFSLLALINNIFPVDKTRVEHYSLPTLTKTNYNLQEATQKLERELAKAQEDVRRASLRVAETEKSLRASVDEAERTRKEGKRSVDELQKQVNPILHGRVKCDGAKWLLVHLLVT